MPTLRLLVLHALGLRCKARRVTRCARPRGSHSTHIDRRGDVWLDTARLDATAVLEQAGERAYREVTDG